ncbi:MAG: AAA family ATPase [Desulfovibrio sp.]|nr:AAA family ATPase [Desulfovibrio sp.]
MENNQAYDSNRLSLGMVDLSNIRKSNMIYVDKTKLLYDIASQRTPLFLSRPRRFGKTLLINTLHSLFEKGLEDFHCLDIEKLWNDTTYKVVHIDFSILADDNPEEFKRDLVEILVQQFKVGDTVSKFDALGIRNPNIVLSEIALNLKANSTVLLVDEYDAPLTHHIHKQNELNDIMRILNNFYSTVKQFTDKFRFIFITGITRTSHISIFSSFNNLKDISLREEFNSLLGFTQDDLVRYFDQYIQNASIILKITKDDVYRRVKQYYDGFQFSLESEQTLYNPWSILNFFDSPQLGFTNYWFQSGGSPSIIMQYLKITDSFNLINYKDSKIYKTRQELSSRYEITTIPPDILLLQAGYFTIRRETSQTARLVLPNTEVEDSMLDLYLAANNIRISNEAQKKIDELSMNIDQRNLQEIISIFNAILNDCVSILSNIFQDERSIRDIIYAALPQELYLQKIKERETTQGFSDLELLTQKTHMVIEFKRTRPDRNAKTSLQEAIEQLQNKQYGIGAFHHLKLYRVAMVLSTDSKSILPEYCREV